jgi:hypothetical protein
LSGKRIFLEAGFFWKIDRTGMLDTFAGDSTQGIDAP